MTIVEVRASLIISPDRAFVRDAYKDGVAPFTITWLTKFIEFDPDDLAADDWEEVQQ